MTIQTSRRPLIAMTGAAALATVLPFPAFAAAPSRKLKIALSNSFVGNKWRIEMENVYKAALQMEPYKSEVEGTWFNSGNNVSRQSQQISNLIAERVDAILVEASSPTGLNGILNQAAERGILVVSFDNIATSPRVLKVNTNQVKFGETWAGWLVKKLNGSGNVIMVTGVAGTSVDEDLNKGADNVWKQHPGIKVVNRYTGMWDSSTAERNTASILPSLPKIDGIWCQGGTDGVLKAFIAAKRTPLPFTAGEAENGFLRFMSPEGYMGQKVEGISLGQPPYLSVVALELARRVLKHEYPRKDLLDVPFPVVTNEMVKAGVTVFPELPDSFFDDFSDAGPNPVVTFCVKAALEGAPCPGRLTVNLPPA